MAMQALSEVGVFVDDVFVTTNTTERVANVRQASSAASQRTAYVTVALRCYVIVRISTSATEDMTCNRPCSSVCLSVCVSAIATLRKNV